ncbi:MAG: gamma-glutamyl-gamma-aminobutyrate hydrolase family protein, partial [Rickettsiales bacterium]
ITTSARKGHFMWRCMQLGVWLAGGRAIRITALNNRPYEHCDGYMISGGADIDPACYGQQNRASVDMEPERDTLEREVITHALKQARPLFGICRGAQMINIVRGGTLHQDARDFYEGFVPTDSVLGKIFTRRTVRITEDGILYRLFEKKPKLSVNSLHHQAIDETGEGIVITARDDHHIPQAIEHMDVETSFILGVQWHPEFMLHSRKHRKLFKTLIRHAIAKV